MPIKYFLQISFFILLTLNTDAQNRQLQLISIDSDSTTLAQIASLPNVCKNQSECQNLLENYIKTLRKKAYITASLDSIYADTLQTKAYVFLGKKYEWLQLEKGNISEKILNQVGFRPQKFYQKAFNWNEVLNLQERLLQYYENHAYPFAEISLQNVMIDENGRITASLHSEKNQLITIDSLLILGNAKISRQYLSNYLDLKSGQFYDENKIQKISQRLRELPFLEEKRAASVLFVGKKANVSVSLKSKKASRFNFLLGVLPQSNANIDGRQRYQITGDGDLSLHNSLGAGELIELKFKSYPPKTQDLQTHIQYPYLPLLPIGLDFKFGLFLRDSLYRQVTTDIGLQYIFKGNNYIKAFWNNDNVALASIDTQRIKISEKLPDLLDITNIWYGLQYHFEQFDYRFSPRKGFSIDVKSSIGTKQIKPNLAILRLGENNNIDFETQYDSLNINKLQFQVKINLTKFWPVTRQSTLKTTWQAAYLQSQQLALSDLYRIGGNQILRGFDEESIFASHYQLASLEYRYLIGQNTYLFAFSDMAYVDIQNKITNSEENINLEKWPFGFGLGLTLETKAGLFGLSYAIGKDSDPSRFVNLRNAKIHFGYVNYF